MRFVAWMTLMSIGFLSLIWTAGIAGLFFCAANLVFMFPRALRRDVRDVTRRELLMVFCVVIAFVITVAALKIFVPALAAHVAARFLRHPAVVISLWLICIWLGYKIWRRKIQNEAS
jgi:hypothetical protein